MDKIHKLTRRQVFLLGLGTLAGISSVATSKNFLENTQIKAQLQLLDDPNRGFPVVADDSLNKRAAAKGLIYGVAARSPDLQSDPVYAEAIAQECGILVPEWEFKWKSGSANLRPNFDSFDFTKADWMINFAEQQGLLFRGHTLVWHLSLPRWFKETVNVTNAAPILEKHIQTVVGRYAGKIHSWDVVNEAIEIKDGRNDGLRITPWLKSLGSNYIDLAFRLTAEADPEALLVYNDYGLDYDTPKDEAKRTALLKLLERLKSQGTPIHALGIQAHLSPGKYKFNPKKLRQFLKDVADLGLKIMITELDVGDKYLPLDLKIRDRIVASVYEDYLSAALDEKAVIAVITWGLSDLYTWLSEFYPRPDKSSVRPLPLDTKMQRKLAWNAIALAFDHAPKR